MPVKVRIPAPLQELTKNQVEVESEGKTIRELIDSLEKSYPGIRERICDEKGKIRPSINIYVNEEDIRFLQGDNTPVKDGAEIIMISAIAGG